MLQMLSGHNKSSLDNLVSQSHVPGPVPTCTFHIGEHLTIIPGYTSLKQLLINQTVIVSQALKHMWKMEIKNIFSYHFYILYFTTANWIMNLQFLIPNPCQNKNTPDCLVVNNNDNVENFNWPLKQN